MNLSTGLRGAIRAMDRAFGSTGWSMYRENAWFSIAAYRQPWRHIYLVTKADTIGWLFPRQKDRDHCLFIHSPHFLSQSALRIVETFSRIGAPGSFIGDLDPLDLCSFLAASEAWGEHPRLRFAGVRASWFDTCRASLRPEWAAPREGIIDGLVGATKLGPFEVAQVRIMLRACVELPALIGDESVKVLRRGYGMDTDGALNPGFYTAGHAARLRALITGTERSAEVAVGTKRRRKR